MIRSFTSWSNSLLRAIRPATQNLAQAPALQVQPSQQEPPIAREAKPNEPSVLVFRDGHQQEVSNYAIMGQTVYVFDKRTQKVALADLDVPATIKANDERGLEFAVPAKRPCQGNRICSLRVLRADHDSSLEHSFNRALTTAFSGSFSSVKTRVKSAKLR